MVEGVLRDVREAHVRVADDGAVPSPSFGSSSPMSILIMVDLPAPLTPMTATREAIETWIEMLLSVLMSRVGYLNEQSVIFLRAPSCAR